MSRVTSIYAAYVGHSTPSDHGRRSDLPGGPATRCFQAKWWAFLDLRHCLPEGSPRNVSKLSGRHSWIFSTTSHWVRHVTSSR
jgi:hypothetical protein